MRHLLAYTDLPDDAPVYIFGASVGGDELREGLARHTDIRLAGVIDDRCSGVIDGHWIIGSTEFFADPPAGAVILISSQHWRIIGRQLRAKGAGGWDGGRVRLLDASPLIRSTQPRLMRGTILDPDEWLAYGFPYTEQAVETALAAAGLSLAALTEAFLPPGLAAERVLHRLRTQARSPSPVYLYGTGEAALEIYGMVSCQPNVHVVGFIGEAGGFIDAIDVSPLDTVLAEEEDDPVFVIASPQGKAAIPRLEARGFGRIIDATPLLKPPLPPPAVPVRNHARPRDDETPVSVVVACRQPAAATLARALESVVAQGHPRLQLVVADQSATDRTRALVQSLRLPVTPEFIEADGFGPALLQALKRCTGAVIGFCPADGVLLPGAITAAVAALRQRPEAVAALDVTAADFTIADLLTGARRPDLAAGFIDRPALEASGLLAEPWQPDLLDLELWCRVIGSGDVVSVDRRFASAACRAPEDAATDPPEAGPARRLAGTIRILGRLAATTGRFGHSGVSLFEALARLYADSFNAVLAAGGEPGRLGVPLPRRPGGLTPVVLPPVRPELYDRLARLAEDRGHADQALALWAAAERRFGAGAASLGACRAVLGHAGSDGEAQGRLIRRLTAGRAAAVPAPGGNPRIHVGYLASRGDNPLFRRRVAPIMARHDRSRYRVFCYVGNVTSEVRRAADTVRGVAGLDDSGLGRMIAADGIDLLVDTDGFAADPPFCALARRYAPIQIGGLGHIGPGGAGVLDGLVTDSVSAPPGLEGAFAEPLHRLSRPVFCLDERLERFAPVQPPPCLAAPGITFGNLDPAAGLNDRVIGWWAEILHEVPDSRLLLASRGLEPASGRACLLARFARHGIEAERLELRPGARFRQRGFEYGDVDIGLDTWPCSGATAVVEALISGVPVVSMAGETLASRFGAALLHAAGCEGLVAETPAAYVARAVALAADREGLARHRARLRHVVWRSALVDAAGLTRELEGVFEALIGRTPARAGQAAPRTAPAMGRFFIACATGMAADADWIADMVNAEPRLFCARLVGADDTELPRLLELAAVMAGVDGIGCGVVGRAVAGSGIPPQVAGARVIRHPAARIHRLCAEMPFEAAVAAVVGEDRDWLRSGSPLAALEALAAGGLPALLHRLVPDGAGIGDAVAGRLARVPAPVAGEPPVWDQDRCAGYRRQVAALEMATCYHELGYDPP